MNKLIEKLGNKLKIVHKMNKPKLNRLYNSVIGSNSTCIRDKTKRNKFKHSISA